jgi:hypothetical protein
MVWVSLANLAASLFRTDWRRKIDRVGPAVGDILAFAQLVADLGGRHLPAAAPWPTTRSAVTASRPAPTSPSARA